MQNSVMTLAEKTNMGLMTTGLGLLVVFAALFLIIIVTSMLSYIMMDKNKKQTSTKNEIIQPAIKIVDTNSETIKTENDNSLIAIITSAIAAYLDEGSGNLIVRSYRNVSSENPWVIAARNSQMNSKF